MLMRSLGLLLFTFAAVAPAEVTYTRDISRMVQTKCQQCHRPNDVAPFALMSYDDVVTYGDDIKSSLTQNKMPPWKPVPGYNEFRDSYALNDEDRATFVAWIDAGMPQGDPADAPDPVPVSDSPWQLGDPDMVLTIPEYTPPPRVSDTYRCFVLPTGLTENRFIAATQALPGNPQITHHVLLFLDEIGEAEKLDGADGQPGYSCFGGPNLTSVVTTGNLLAAPLASTDFLHGLMLGGWVPGSRARRLPEDIGIPIPKGARIVMQVHYHPAGREGSDQTQLGIWFADTTKIAHRLINVPIANMTFQIPAGAANYQVEAKLTTPLAVKVITIAPHMHNLGRQIKVEVQGLGSATAQPLIRIDDWDFNWQGFYTLAQPAAVAAFSTVKVTAVYDNSDGNPKNPNNPIVPVGWGERTIDEMCLAFIGVIFDNEVIIPFPFNEGRR
jgi:Copper type II ascorbate-dependent monooxygenase, C-terminal domain